MKRLMILISMMLVVASGIHAQQNLTWHQRVTGNSVQANSGEETGEHYTAELPLRINSRSCSSFCLDDNGHEVFGTNYDNDKPEGMVFINKRGISKSGFIPGTTGRVAKWASKYASITFTVVSYQLAWAGMNEKGLVMSTMALPETQNPEADERPPLHSPHWMQYMLDNCGSVKEVIAADSQVQIFETVDHYLVADRMGHCATIEFLDGKMIVHAGKRLPAAVLTNSTYSESAGFLEKGAAGVKAKNGVKTISSSLRRFQIAADRVKAFRPTGNEDAVDYAFGILDSVGGEGTLWSIVFDTQDLTAYFRTQKHRPIRYLSLNDFDLSCDTPDMMIDIDEKLEGNIAESMHVYSSDKNFTFVKKALVRWDIPMSEEQLQAIRTILDSYECKQSH
jgi:penicillin V acylase-like amidase (Ntn superfamily)